MSAAAETIVLSTRSHGGASSSCRRSFDDSLFDVPGDSVIAMTVWERTIFLRPSLFRASIVSVQATLEISVELGRTLEISKVD